MSYTGNYGYFDPNKQISKYKLDGSTFDLIDVDRFKNTKFGTVFWFLFAWVMMILSWVLLGSDIYTCLNILVFHHWSTDTYKPYAYSIAKWIFTGCILFEFVLMAYKLIKGIYTYRTRNIALAYVNNIARLLYSVKSYNYFCLFNAIDHDNFFDWACFLCHTELSGSPQLLIADTPRQVINFLTLRYYATNEGSSNDILQNIKTIADSNITLSIILSFVLLSVVIWCIFFFKFCFAMILYLPVMYKLRERGFKSLKKYCCSVVNERVRDLVFKNHRPKNELLELGIVDLKGIASNPLLQSSTTSLNLNKNDNDMVSNTNGILRPSAARTFANIEKNNYSSQFEMTALSNLSSTNIYDTRNMSTSSLTHHNPFNDSNKFTSRETLLKPHAYTNESFMRDNLKNPFISKSEISLGSASTIPNMSNSNNLNRRVPPYVPYEETLSVNDSTYNSFTHESSDADLHLESLQEEEEVNKNFDNADSDSHITYKGESEEIESEFDYLSPEEKKRSLSLGFDEATSIGSETEFMMGNNPQTQTLETPYPIRGVSLYKNSDDDDNNFMNIR